MTEEDVYEHYRAPKSHTYSKSRNSLPLSGDIAFGEALQFALPLLQFVLRRAMASSPDIRTVGTHGPVYTPSAEQLVHRPRKHIHGPALYIVVYDEKNDPNAVERLVELYDQHTGGTYHYKTQEHVSRTFVMWPTLDLARLKPQEEMHVKEKVELHDASERIKQHLNAIVKLLNLSADSTQEEDYFKIYKDKKLRTEEILDTLTAAVEEHKYPPLANRGPQRKGKLDELPSLWKAGLLEEYGIREGLLNDYRRLPVGSSSV